MSGLTDKEIDEAFALFDLDKSGKIDAKELKSVLKVMFPKDSDADIEAVAGVSSLLRLK